MSSIQRSSGHDMKLRQAHTETTALLSFEQNQQSLPLFLGNTRFCARSVKGVREFDRP
jgi:hypothetical protein